MLEKDKLKNALAYISSGKRGEARKLLLDIYQQTSNDNFKLQSILGLVVIPKPNPLATNKELIKICEDGMSIAYKLKDYVTQAYLMARKAGYLLDDVSIYIYRRKNINLALDWIDFSLESDRDKFYELTKNIEDNEKQAETLFKKATQIAEQNNRKDVKANILMFLGGSYGTKWLNYKMEHFLKSSKRAKFSKCYLLRRFNLDNYLIFSRKDRKKIKKYKQLCIKNLLEAIELSNSIGDEINEAHALFDLVIQLKTMYSFRKARKYLRQAKIIAKKHNNTGLLTRINEMEKIIRAKNKDIPNYIEGEIRDLNRK